MVRGKVEMKKIEKTSSRHVAFSKRRKGLIKKAHDLSVLCDADVAVVVFSTPGRLYDFCTAKSFPGLVERYWDSVLDDGSLQNAYKAENNGVSKVANVQKCEELQRMLDRNFEEYISKLSTKELALLQEQLKYLVKETTARKTNLQLESITALHEKKKMLLEEKELLQKEIAGAMKEDEEKEAEPEEEMMNHDACNQRQLTTLSLLRW